MINPTNKFSIVFSGKVYGNIIIVTLLLSLILWREHRTVKNNIIRVSILIQCHYQFLFSVIMKHR